MPPTDVSQRIIPALAGALAGSALAGAYGAPVGALMGVMGAEIFHSQRFKSELRAHLLDPGKIPAPIDEPEPGLALLAGIAATEARRLGAASEAAVQAARELGSIPPRASAWLARALSTACAAKDTPLSFALMTAAFDGRAPRNLRPAAAELLFSLLKLIRQDLDAEGELATASRLAALGVSEADVRWARRKFFPDYRDAWDILGVPPGSDKDEIRKAWRRVSRRLHPDNPQGNPEDFRKAKEAYDRLRKG